MGVRERVVYLFGAGVNDGDHREIDRHLLVWRRKVCSMAFGLVAFEEDATDYGPYDRRICAALSCSVNGKEFAVRVELIGDSQDGLEFVFGFFKGTGVNEDDVPV